MIFCNFYFN